MAIARTFFKYWLPVMVWMAVIFTASADTHSYQHSSTLFEPLLHWLFPSLSQSTVARLHEDARKCCHLAEYAVLALLLWRAIHHSVAIFSFRHLAPERSEGGWKWDEAGLVLAIVFFYAATDEFHQIFVRTRTPHVTDVLIDTAGGAIGLLLLWVGGKSAKQW